MKKAVVSLSILFLLSFPLDSFAESNETTNNIPSIVEDKEKKPTKSFEPLPLNTNGEVVFAAATSTPHWVASSDFTSTSAAVSTSDSYTSSTKTTKRTIDRIYANTRAYVDGIFKGSKSDNNYGSSHAGASVTVSKTFYQDGEALGSHKFEESGFQSWYPETSGT